MSEMATDTPLPPGVVGAVLGALKPSVFAMQIVVSASIMIFSMVQLAKGEPIEVYLPVLTGVSGYWLPAPRDKSSEQKAYEKAHDRVGAQLALLAAPGSNVPRSISPPPVPFGSPVTTSRATSQIEIDVGHVTPSPPVANVA